MYVIQPTERREWQYKYQGQERQDELNLNWDSFKWRNYDFAIGRFMSVDPLAEDYSYNSTYAFAENKVIWSRELEGLESWYTTTQSTNPNDNSLFKPLSGPLDSNTAKDAGYTTFGTLQTNYSFSDSDVQRLSDWNSSIDKSYPGHCLGAAITGSELLTGADSGMGIGPGQLSGLNAFDLGNNLTQAGVATPLGKVEQGKEMGFLSKSANTSGTENTAFIAGIAEALHSIIIVKNTSTGKVSMFDQHTGWDKKNVTTEAAQTQLSEIGALLPEWRSKLWQLSKSEKIEVKQPIE